MLTMRIYALYKRNVRAFVVFIFISSALFAGGCVSIPFLSFHFAYLIATFS